MKVKYVDKHYLFYRDGMHCRFCGKVLRYDKMSIDHYLPRSLGGTDDVFNLVSSCKRCNCQKQNKLPEDVEAVHIRQFIDGVAKKKILPTSALGMTPVMLETIASEVNRSYPYGHVTVFESNHYRLYVEDNKVTKTLVINVSSE